MDMYIESLKQTLRLFHSMYSDINWMSVFFVYAFDEIEILSCLALIFIAGESLYRYRRISRSIFLDNLPDSVENLVKVLDKRRLFVAFYCSFIIIRISYILFRFIFAIIDLQQITGKGGLDLGLEQDLFHSFTLNHSMPIFIEGVFLSLMIILYGILSYWYNRMDSYLSKGPPNSEDLK